MCDSLNNTADVAPLIPNETTSNSRPEEKLLSDAEETPQTPDKTNKEKDSSSHTDNAPDSQELSPPPTTIPLPPTSKSNLGKYKLVRTIGKGNFAKVKLAIHMATGVEVFTLYLTFDYFRSQSKLLLNVA